MGYNPRIHHRRSMRLKGWDYDRPSWYYLTMVTHNRQRVFGKIDSGTMILSTAGKIADFEWNGIPGRFPGVSLDAFVVMPDHLHGIIIINDDPEGEIPVGGLINQTPDRYLPFGVIIDDNNPMKMIWHYHKCIQTHARKTARDPIPFKIRDLSCSGKNHGS